MSHRSVHASAKKARRITPTLATGAACAAVTGLLGLGMSAPAAAADKTVEDAVFDWSVNDESTGGSYFGGCNFLVAGEAGDAGSARIWNRDDADNVYPTDAEGNFVDGNTSIVKTNGKKSTFDTKCRTGDGVSVNGKINAQAENNHTGDRVEIKNGTGTIDPDGDNASIQWDGSWSFAYYGGMTYWTISDPKLEVKDGKGTITGTYSGYGADMDDPSIWLKLKPREGEVVEIQNGEVDVTDEGFEFLLTTSVSRPKPRDAIRRLRRALRTNPGGVPCLRTGSTSTSRPVRTRIGSPPPVRRHPSSRARRRTQSRSNTPRRPQRPMSRLLTP